MWRSLLSRYSVPARATGSLPLRYGGAVLTIALVGTGIPALRLILRSDFPGEVSSPLFLLAIVFSAWYGGIGPGLLAAGLALLTLDYYFMSSYSLHPGWQSLPLVTVYLLTPIFVSILDGMRCHAAAAVRKVDAEMRVARAIQQRLFPLTSPQPAEFDIAGACRTVQATGGDLFDFIPMRNRRIGIVIADATGHSFAAALLMVQVRAYLRALAQTHDSVSEILFQTNAMLAEDAEDDLFVTLFYACLDLENRSLVYAGAGHEGYILHATGRYERLRSTSPPLGVDKGLVVPSAAIQLQSGDSVILLTDGVIEAASPQRAMSGIDRIIEILNRDRARSAREMIDLLFKSVEVRSHQRSQEDDMTAVIVKVRPRMAA